MIIKGLKKTVLALGLMSVAAPALALQCVPYARETSGVEIFGNAKTWWGQAAGRYERGFTPKVGAVMAFKPTRAMPIVAVWPPVSPLPAKLRRFVDHVAAELKQPAWHDGPRQDSPEPAD